MSILNVYRWPYYNGSDYCESILYHESQKDSAGRLADALYLAAPYSHAIIRKNKHYLMAYDFQDRLRIYTLNQVNKMLTVISVRGYGK